MRRKRMGSIRSLLSCAAGWASGRNRSEEEEAEESTRTDKNDDEMMTRSTMMVSSGRVVSY
jgi:hypothetical protein